MYQHGYQNCKYGISPKELREARKLIIEDIKSNNKVDNPIQNMTLQDYFRIIMYCMFALADKNGVVRDRFGNTWYSELKKKDIRKLSSKEIAEEWQDGRGLFTEHANINHNNINYGNWANINNFNDNKCIFNSRCI